MKMSRNLCLAAHIAGPVALIGVPVVDEGRRTISQVGRTVGAGQELVATSRYGVVAVGQVGTVRRVVEVTRSCNSFLEFLYFLDIVSPPLELFP